MLIPLAALLAGLYALAVRLVAGQCKPGKKRTSNKPLPSVTALVPSYMSEATLPKTLESLRDQDYPLREIVVVNNGPRGRVPEICRKHRARLFHTSERKGKDSSLNLAAGKVRSDILLFVDSDTALEKGAVSALVPWLSKPGFAAVSPRVSNLNTRGLSSLVSLENSFGHAIQKASMKSGTILSFRGCAAAVKSTAFREVGGWPESLVDDMEFSAALLRAGYRIGYEPGVSALTTEPENLSQLKSQKFRWGKGAVRSFLNNGDIHSRHTATQISYCLPFFLTFFSMAFLFPALALYPFQPQLSISLLDPFLSLFLADLIYLLILLLPESSPREALLIVPYSALYLPLLTLIYTAGILSGLCSRKEAGRQDILRDWKPLQA
jgi:cellulose synthase/poly-beta-1,6-N-acetylglucosamine synthase-like glycosyltransferase